MKPAKNILLVYPEVPRNTCWSFHYALKFVGRKSAMPPLGLVTLAALFPRTCTLKLVDMNVQPLTDQDIAWADAVFVSAMIIQKDSFEKVVAGCNRLKTPVVAGGPYPTSSHAEIAGVDHFVLGEVDATFADFFGDLCAGRARPVVPPPRRPDISRLPTPRFDLLDLRAYSSMSVQYSRGCPFHCEFCDIWKVYGNRKRVKKELQPPAGPYRQGAVFPADLVTLVKSLACQPFTGYGYRYVCFLMRSLVKNRPLFPEAVKFGIVGHHFHTITRQTVRSEKIAAYLDTSYTRLREQIAACSTALDNSGDQAVRKIHRLWHRREKVLARTRRRIGRMHRDFRADVFRKYTEVAEKTWDLFKPHKDCLQRQSVWR